MVLVHGVTGSGAVFGPLVPLLEERFRVARVDLLGYGRSAKPRHLVYTPAAHVAAIRDNLSALGIQPPYSLVGLSMGVGLVLEYARTWPEEVAGLACLGFPYYPSEALARIGLSANAYMRLVLRHPRVGAVVIPAAFAIGRHSRRLRDRFSKIYTPEMTRESLWMSYHAFRSSLEHCMVELRPEASLAASGARRRLFVHGELDLWASPEAIAEVIDPYPRSELVVLEGVAHNVAVHAPEATADHLFRHLDAVLAE